jgi:hypothetical protein
MKKTILIYTGKNIDPVIALEDIEYFVEAYPNRCVIRQPTIEDTNESLDDFIAIDIDLSLEV